MTRLHAWKRPGLLVMPTEDDVDPFSVTSRVHHRVPRTEQNHPGVQYYETEYFRTPLATVGFTLTIVRLLVAMIDSLQARSCPS